MTNNPVVVSLFGGMECGLQALKNIGVSPSVYISSEINTYSMDITRANHPEVIHVGDITKVRYANKKLYFGDGQSIELPKVDLLIGGSPCQGFSAAGMKRGLMDERSRLFFEYARLLEEIEPADFMLENVLMDDFSMGVISDVVNVEPFFIESAYLSPQLRKRLYWSSWDIAPIDPTNYYKYRFSDIVDKSAGGYVPVPSRHINPYKHLVPLMGITYHSGKLRGVDVKRYKAKSQKKYIKKMQLCPVDKAYCLLESEQMYTCKLDSSGLTYRNYTIGEAELMQGVPLGYTSCVSYTRGISALGNGWNIPTIEHIFKSLVSESMPKHYPLF